MKIKFFNQSGQVSRLLLVLAIIIFVAGLIVFLVVRMAERPQSPIEPNEETPLPKYEQTLDDIKFVFIDALDLGNALTPETAVNKNNLNRQTVRTTEKFVIVTIGAQNKGKENLKERSWDVGDIVDSEGRRFVAVKKYEVDGWVPENSDCGALLKPEFDPVPCARIYEVSKISKDLKVIVITSEGNRTDVSSGNNKEALIDLIVR